VGSVSVRQVPGADGPQSSAEAISIDVVQRCKFSTSARYSMHNNDFKQYWLLEHAMLGGKCGQSWRKSAGSRDLRKK
jgi:hypothetical protein